jgi:hypothetical protein
MVIEEGGGVRLVVWVGARRLAIYQRTGGTASGQRFKGERPDIVIRHDGGPRARRRAICWRLWPNCGHKQPLLSRFVTEASYGSSRTARQA